jgi:hypothetical protein
MMLLIPGDPSFKNRITGFRHALLLHVAGMIDFGRGMLALSKWDKEFIEAG